MPTEQKAEDDIAEAAAVEAWRIRLEKEKEEAAAAAEEEERIRQKKEEEAAAAEQMRL